MEFNESKKAGDVIEKEILRIIKKRDENAYIDDRGKKNSDWDIYLPTLDYGIEVKGDYKSKYTGNLVIEISFNGKPSALSISKAKWWVFVEGYRFIWIRPINIYRFLMENRQQYREPAHFVGDGDNRYKDAFLINHSDFIKFVYTLDDEEGFVKMIPKSHILYYDNYTKKSKAIKND